MPRTLLHSEGLNRVVVVGDYGYAVDGHAELHRVYALDWALAISEAFICREAWAMSTCPFIGR